MIVMWYKINNKKFFILVIVNVTYDGPIPMSITFRLVYFIYWLKYTFEDGMTLLSLYKAFI